MADQATNALIDFWRKRVSESRQSYLLAKATAANITYDVSEGLYESADGGFALRQAIQAETVTLREYTRAVQILTDLVVRGMNPPRIEP